MKTPDKPSYWRIMMPIKSSILLAMLCASGGVIFTLLTILLIAALVTGYASSKAIVLLTVATTILAYMLRGLSFKISHQGAFSLERILRLRLSSHLARLPLGVLQDQGSATLTKVICDDVRQLHGLVADSTPLAARAFISPILTFIILLYVDWRLALVASAVLIIGMVIISLAMRDSTELAARYHQAREKVSQAVIEFVQAMPVVRTFDNGKSSFGRYESALNQYLAVLSEWYARSGIPARLSMIILSPLLTLVVIVAVGFMMIEHQQSDFATWVIFLLLGTGMAESWLPLMTLYHILDQAKMSIERIYALEALAPLPISATPRTPQDHSVAFERVSFRYGERSENALEDITFTVPAGSFTALVGASGAGKTTVAKLIPRFWDVSAGAVKVGQVDVRDIAPETLMKTVSFVFQDHFLFSGSIADNIRLGEEDKTMTDVVLAAQAAQADAFIRELPRGYDTEVGERGLRLSGGQRQRITIARAILQNRPILVLDEATAFADAENEALFMQALSALMAGKTVLMIAHRLTTIQHADQILYFEDGKLRESGTPAALQSDENSAYAKLWRAYQNAQNWQICTDTTEKNLNAGEKS